jgi:hypothetical protein
MNRRSGYVLVGVVVLVVVLILTLRRKPPAPVAETASNRDRSRKVPIVFTGVVSQAGETSVNNPVQVPAALISEANKFIMLTKPYGLDSPISSQNVIYFTNHAKSRTMLETKSHIIEFTGNKLHNFLAKLDSSNPVAKPEQKQQARSKWYEATGKWTNDEALAETQKIMQTLGIGGVQWESTNVEPFTIDVRNPDGKPVNVTPFYRVILRAPHNTLTAEFRMGQSGPGRLTEWYVWPPLPK